MDLSWLEVPPSTSRVASQPFPSSTLETPRPPDLSDPIPHRLRFSPPPLGPSTIPSCSLSSAAHSLPFLSPSWPDFSITSTLPLSSLFGGLHFSSILPEASFTSQYNVSSWLSRPFMGGREGSLVPLLPPRLLKGALDTPPDTVLYDAHAEQYRAKNRLAAIRRGEKMEIWSVAERSKGKVLERVDARIGEEGRLYRPRLREERKMKKAVQELRMTRDGSGVWIRDAETLRMAKRDLEDNETGKGIPVFKGVVRMWTESEVMEGDMMVVENGGRLWTGTKEALVKCEYTQPVQLASYSDHPCVLNVVVSTTSPSCSLVSLDLRCPSDPSTLFTTPPLFIAQDDYSYKFPRLHDDPSDPSLPPIRHILSLPSSPRYTVIIADRNLYVMDERVRSTPLLSSAHPLKAGGDFVFLAPPLKTRDNEVFTVTMMSHQRPVVVEWKILRHQSGILSTVEPMKRLPETIKKWRQGRTTDVAIVEVEQGRQARIRQMDNGSLWYERIGGEDMNMEEEEVGEGWWSEESEWERALHPILKNNDKKEMVMTVNGLPRRDVNMDRLIRRMERAGKNMEKGRTGKRLKEEVIEEVKKGADEYSELAKAVQNVYEKHIGWNAESRAEEEPVEEEEAVGEERNEEEEEEDQGLSWILFPFCYYKWAIIAGAPEDACGFRGSFTHSARKRVGKDDESGVRLQHYDTANLAQTYSALLCLSILGDDLTKVKRTAILNSIRKCQTEQGCFASQGAGSECDMRFVFCAVAICYILGDDSAIDWRRLGAFIRDAVAYDGGIGQMPGEESHGGSTYCAIASLSLSNRLWDESVLSKKQLDRLVRWAVLKQDRGFHGRANKQDDSCYAFWTGATLEMLSAYPLVGQSALRDFLLSVQHPHMGGFCKLDEPGAYPDVLHTYFSLAAMSLLKEAGVPPTHAPLNCSRRVHESIARRRLQLARLPSSI